MGYSSRDLRRIALGICLRCDGEAGEFNHCRKCRLRQSRDARHRRRNRRRGRRPAFVTIKRRQEAMEK